MKKKPGCYGCVRDPENTSKDVTWVSCDFCNVWYHEVCAKLSIYRKMNPEGIDPEGWKNVHIDEDKQFKCEVCLQLE